MAVTKYITNSGAGTNSGDSVANAYTPAQALTYLSTATINQDFFMRFCGDFTFSSAFVPTKDGTNSARIYYQGYNSAGTSPALSTITLSGSPNGFDPTACDYSVFQRFRVTSNNTGLTGFDFNDDCDEVLVEDCIVDHCDVGFFNTASAAGITYHRCAALRNNNGYGFNIGGSNLLDCLAVDNDTGGITGTSSNVERCVAYGNHGYGIQCFKASHCISANNDAAAFMGIGTGGVHIRNRCVAINNSGLVGYDHNGSTRWQILQNCANYGGSRTSSGYTIDNSPITLNSDPFISVADGDFRVHPNSYTTMLMGGSNNTNNTWLPYFPASIAVSGDNYPITMANYRDIGTFQSMRAKHRRTHVL